MRLRPEQRLYFHPAAMDSMERRRRGVYVVSFDNGMVKVGSTARPKDRLTCLVRHVAMVFGCSMADAQLIPTEFHRRTEVEALRLIRLVATPVGRTNEYFTGISFDDALAVVRSALPA